MSSFKVVYCDGNDDSLMEPTMCTYDQVSHLRKNEICKEGYSFKGWYGYRVSDKKVCYVERETNKKKFYKEGKQPENWTPYLYRDECKVSRTSKVDGDVIMMRAQWEREIMNAPEHAAENREILREKLLHRSIVLFGGGVTCKNFYRKYHKILNIRCILTDEKKEEQIKFEDGTTVQVEPYSKNKIRSDDYIIICRPVNIWFDEYYKNARNALTHDGFEHMKDFMRSSIASALLDKKKLWLWMGYCQFDIISQILTKVKSINQEFLLESVRVGKDTVKTSYKFQDCKDMVKICDFLVSIPLIIAEGKRDFDFEELLPKDAKALIIPSIVFRGYYPYKDDNIDARHKYTYDRRTHWPFKHAENVLDELILKGLNDDEIYEEVMREDFIDKSVIQKNLKLAYKSIQISESTADIKILDYIKENFTDHMLYRDGLHYQNDLYFELARRVAKYLNLDVIDEINSQELEAEKTGKQYHAFTEIPVLPCVAKALGLDFITDDTLWRVRFTEKGQEITSKYEIRMMTRKEWIYAYVAYTRAQMTLCDFWNLKDSE